MDAGLSIKFAWLSPISQGVPTEHAAGWAGACRMGPLHPLQQHTQSLFCAGSRPFVELVATGEGLDLRPCSTTADRIGHCRRSPPRLLPLWYADVVNGACFSAFNVLFVVPVLCAQVCAAVNTRVGLMPCSCAVAGVNAQASIFKSVVKGEPTPTILPACSIRAVYVLLLYQACH